MKKRKKISIIGAGAVGSSFARCAIEGELGNIVLIDVNEDLARGKALDLAQAGAIAGKDISVIGGSDYELIKDSDLVVVTAGFARQPGMSREDLLRKNAEIIKNIAQKVKELSEEAFVIVVTNPLDVMTYLFWKITGFSEKKVMGMAGVLDCGRMKYFLSKEMKSSPKDFEPVILGIHGDSMLVIPRLSTYKGKPITKVLSEEKIKQIVEKTKNGGAEIVSLLKTGSAYYGPAEAIFEMAEAILKNRKKILICSVLLNGQFEIDDCFLGMKVKLSEKGIEKVFTPKLNDEEIEVLRKSSEALKESYKLIAIN